MIKVDLPIRILKKDLAGECRAKYSLDAGDLRRAREYAECNDMDIHQIATDVNFNKEDDNEALKAIQWYVERLKSGECNHAPSLKKWFDKYKNTTFTHYIKIGRRIDSIRELARFDIFLLAPMSIDGAAARGALSGE